MTNIRQRTVRCIEIHSIKNITRNITYIRHNKRAFAIRFREFYQPNINKGFRKYL